VPEAERDWIDFILHCSIWDRPFRRRRCGNVFICRFSNWFLDSLHLGGVFSLEGVSVAPSTLVVDCFGFSLKMASVSCAFP